MKIITLIEDTTKDDKLKAEHGLSLYIETNNQKILMDTGKSDATWQNAKTLGIDIAKIDTVVISHSHYDHTGGLCSFAEKNKHAKIFMAIDSLGDFYHGDRYIGADKKIKTFENLNLVKGNVKVDEGVELFSEIKGRKFWPEGNCELTKSQDGVKVQDDFSHEQCLVVEENGKKFLFSGCAHNGIINIIDRFIEIYGEEPDVVVSGFHMIKNGEYTKEDISNIEETAHELSMMKTKFYTGHCTGERAYEIMKNVLGDKLELIYTGRKIDF